MIELRVIEGGLSEIPREVFSVMSAEHAALATICESMAAYFEACPPAKVDAWLARTRRLLRRMARRFQEDTGEINYELPECAALTQAVGEYMRLCARDIANAHPGNYRDFAQAHRHASKRFGR